MHHTDVTIRGYCPEDREAIRRISCATALSGASADRVIGDTEVLADALTGYFTDREPGSCFVAVQGEVPVGYIMGALDVRLMRRTQEKELYPSLLLKAAARGFFLKARSLRFLSHLAAAFMKGEFSSPDFSAEYPATLHINIDPQFRGEGIGSHLIARYLEHLRQNNVRGVHMGSMSEDAKRFFMREGFALLCQGRRSYLRYCLGRDLPFYVLGKKL